MVITSPEKIRSHELINSVLFKWIRFQMQHNNRAQIFTMPASSGKQEMQILQHIADVSGELEVDRFEPCVRLTTFDNRFESYETGIHAWCKDAWMHYKCTDIFRKILKLRFRDVVSKIPTAAWFDLCGGLTDSNYEGMQGVVDSVFTDGSLLFTTLAISGVRKLDKGSRISRMYDSFSSGTLRRKIATDVLLCEMVESVGKYIRPVFEPYVYKRTGSPTTYGVFGYIVGER